MPVGYNFFNQKAQRIVKGFPRKVFSQQGRKGHKAGIFQDQTFVAFAALLCQFLSSGPAWEPVGFSPRGRVNEAAFLR
jgi:hypothetical protein